MTQPSPGPRAHLATVPATLVALGMVMSTDVLKTAPTVAMNVAPALFGWVWVAGGLASLVGALCYVEMASAFPHAGGEYHFLARAWGSRLGALYAWSRFAVMHTGWIALMAHLLADYVGAVVPLGMVGHTLVAVGVVAALGLLNLVHVRVGFATQALLIAGVALGFAAVALAGVLVSPPPAALGSAHRGELGVALIYVFLAYGGWSDMATLSAELVDRKHGIARVTIGAIALLVALYLALNLAMAHGLGMAGLAVSRAPGAELARMAFGPGGALLVSGVVVVSAAASINSTLIVGARITAAAAADIAVLRPIAGWHASRGTPQRASLAVAGFALVLTALAGLGGNGFGAMVDYMTPVYWLFIALGMAAAMRLRRQTRGGFRTPLYPLFPASFAVLALAMLWSSLTELGPAALAGAGVMAIGALVLEAGRKWWSRGGSNP